jgi:ribosomal protein S18 acetylase RimI-like enzyme
VAVCHDSDMPTAALSARDWAELADRNLAEMARASALWDPRGEVEVRDDFQLVASGTRFPAGQFNAAQALRAAPDAERARAWLARALAFYTARGRGFSVYVRGERDAALRDACLALGMVEGGAPPGMLLVARLPERELPPGCRIERISDARGLLDFAAVAGKGFALHGMPENVAGKVFANPERVLSPELACYVAYLGERPASTALYLMSHGIAGLYWIATHPELHRGGLGSAITRHASNAAFDAGAAAVILQASTHGEPVYRRLGFQHIADYRWYFMTTNQLAAHKTQEIGPA